LHNVASMQNNNTTMEQVPEFELSAVDGGVNGWVAAGAGAAAAITCLASGGLAFGPWGWAGCAVGGAMIGVGTYIL
jgi:hypothetical protein